MDSIVYICSDMYSYIKTAKSAIIRAISLS
jgi:hypothetical protein